MIPVVFINCRKSPFLRWILSGGKKYETRTRNTLERFIGKRVLLAETGNGKPMVRCLATITDVIEIRSMDEWDFMQEEHCVPIDSEYYWKPGLTSVKWLYKLEDIRPVDPFRLSSSARRHGRIWAECTQEFST